MEFGVEEKPPESESERERVYAYVQTQTQTKTQTHRQTFTDTQAQIERARKDMYGRILAVVFIFFLLLFFLRSIAGHRGWRRVVALHATMSKEDMWRTNTGI